MPFKLSTRKRERPQNKQRVRFHQGVPVFVETPRLRAVRSAFYRFGRWNVCSLHLFVLCFSSYFCIFPFVFFSVFGILCALVRLFTYDMICVRELKKNELIESTARARVSNILAHSYIIQSKDKKTNGGSDTSVSSTLYGQVICFRSPERGRRETTLKMLPFACLSYALENRRRWWCGRRLYIFF